jgi:acetyltransferase-like isoleucine patch superfamily enzyme
MVERLQKEMRECWERDLPLEELLCDRWERAQRLGFGTGSSIYQSSYVYGDVSVGEETWIGPLTLLEGSGGLSIGSHCSISAGTHIYTHDSVRWALSGGSAKYERAPVHIGDCCHIGANVVILKGVTIGHHAVIGASSLVNKDVAPYTIAVGSPCHPAGKVKIGKDGEIALEMFGSAETG